MTSSTTPTTPCIELPYKYTIHLYHDHILLARSAAPFQPTPEGQAWDLDSHQVPLVLRGVFWFMHFAVAFSTVSCKYRCENTASSKPCNRACYFRDSTLEGCIQAPDRLMLYISPRCAVLKADILTPATPPSAAWSALTRCRTLLRARAVISSVHDVVGKY